MKNRTSRIDTADRYESIRQGLNVDLRAGKSKPTNELHYEPSKRVNAPRFEYSGLTVNAKTAKDTQVNKDQIKQLRENVTMKELYNQRTALRQEIANINSDIRWVHNRFEEMGNHWYVRVFDSSIDNRVLLCTRADLNYRLEDNEKDLAKALKALTLLEEKIEEKENKEEDPEQIKVSGHRCYKGQCTTIGEDGQEVLTFISNGENKKKPYLQKGDKVQLVVKRNTLTLGGDSSKTIMPKFKSEPVLELKGEESPKTIVTGVKATVQVKNGSIKSRIKKRTNVQKGVGRDAELIARDQYNSRTDIAKGENVRHLSNHQLRKRHEEGSRWNKDVESVMSQSDKGYVKKQGGSPKAGGIPVSNREKEEISSSTNVMIHKYGKNPLRQSYVVRGLTFLG